jgi:hypothetical protein
LTLTLLILGAVLAPFVIHELGHWAIAKANGIPLVWGRDRWRLVWVIHADAAPSESVRRQIAIAGFWMEALGALTLLAVVPALPDLAYSSAAYAAVFLWHFWTYAVLQDGPYDDFRVLRP